MRTTYTVKDVLTGIDHTIDIDSEGGGIAIRLQGTACKEDDNAGPVFIEFYGGQPRVVVWPDINSEESEVIDLSNAMETNRE
jgi:hypothetical protein